MNLHRESATYWSVSGHDDIRSVEISSGLEDLLRSHESLGDGERVESINGRSIDRVLMILLSGLQNPERNVEFGELDFSKFRWASTR